MQNTHPRSPSASPSDAAVAARKAAAHLGRFGLAKNTHETKSGAVCLARAIEKANGRSRSVEFTKNRLHHYIVNSIQPRLTWRGMGHWSDHPGHKTRDAVALLRGFAGEMDREASAHRSRSQART